ncbi:MAG: RHS repeat-associated core domain-containing protein, partial [Planctomycetes bacterium]|nr:RHS repeat-associated core domain-containing protein [Planctomycetota bacterium]
MEYTYNALGRRSQKHEILGLDDDYIRYYYNKDYQVLSETDEDDAELRSFVYGRGLDEVLLMLDPNGTDYYYLHDHLKSVVAVVDEDGDILERYEYDAYGQPTMWLGDYDTLNQEISPYGNPYYFTGRRVDEIDNGAWMIQYNRNRFYDYYTGRWLNQDPIGYQDGVNLYAYVNSNPVNRMDSMGLCQADCDQSLIHRGFLSFSSIVYDKGRKKILTLTEKGRISLGITAGHTDRHGGT